MQGRERSQPNLAQAAGSQVDQAAARRAATSSAFSRHPDLADAPMLDMSVEFLEEGSNKAPPARPLAPVFIPPVVTPAVERMLQVNWHCTCTHVACRLNRITHGVKFS